MGAHDTSWDASVGAFDHSVPGADYSAILTIDGGDGAPVDIQFNSPIQIDFQSADFVITAANHHELQALIHQPGKLLTRLKQIIESQLPEGFHDLIEFIFQHGGREITKAVIELFRPTFAKWKAEGCALVTTASPTVICDYLFRGRAWLHLIPGNAGKILRQEVAKGHAACVTSFTIVRKALLDFCGGDTVATTCTPTHTVTTHVAGPGLCCKMVGPAFHKIGDTAKVTDKKGHCGTCEIVPSKSAKHTGRPVFKFVRGGQLCPTSVKGCCGLLTVS